MSLSSTHGYDECPLFWQDWHLVPLGKADVAEEAAVCYLAFSPPNYPEESHLHGEPVLAGCIDDIIMMSWL